MTMMIREKATCGYCGQSSPQKILICSRQSGHTDLDMRPPLAERLFMDTWIQCCPYCGYCASDIGKFDEKCRGVLESKAYRAQLKNVDYPSLANSFICSGMIQEFIGKKNNAAGSYLCAAWVLEDAGKNDLAKKWRSRVADLLLDFVKQSKGNNYTEKLVLIDCLRRLGRGKDVLSVIDGLLRAKTEEIIQQVAAFQKKLIEKEDVETHSLAEIE